MGISVYTAGECVCVCVCVCVLESCLCHGPVFEQSGVSAIMSMHLSRSSSHNHVLSSHNHVLSSHNHVLSSHNHVCCVTVLSWNDLV
jgi:hypothetical protein